jgi:hypothetical protein
MLAAGHIDPSGIRVQYFQGLPVHFLLSVVPGNSDLTDYSVFAVLPPFNTIHAHLMDSTGRLVTTPSGYALTYQAISDPLTNTLNTTSVGKTNFWQYAAAIGFGALSPDVGLKGFAMPGAGNNPQAMAFSTSDDTCHGSNALGLAGFAGIPPFTTPAGTVVQPALTFAGITIPPVTGHASRGRRLVGSPRASPHTPATRRSRRLPLQRP